MSRSPHSADEDPGADESVEVLARIERLDQPGILRQVRHDAHLDLRVVGGEQCLVSRLPPWNRPRGCAGSPPCAPGCSAGWGRCSTAARLASRSATYVVRDPAIRGDRGVERLDDLAQLGRLAMLQEEVEERMRVGLLQIGQHRGIRRVAGLRLAGLRQLQLVEQHLLQLLGRPEVHLAPDRRERLLGDGVGALGEVAGESRELVVRDGHAGQLHVGESQQGRQFDVGEDAVATLGGQLGTQCRGDSEVNQDSCPGVAPSVSGTSWVGSALGQLLIQVAVDQVGEGLVGEARAAGAIRRRRVEGQSAQTQARAAERLDLRLRVAEDLRSVGRRAKARRDAATSGVQSASTAASGVAKPIRAGCPPSSRDRHADLGVAAFATHAASAVGARLCGCGHRRPPRPR